MTSQGNAGGNMTRKLVSEALKGLAIENKQLPSVTDLREKVNETRGISYHGVYKAIGGSVIRFAEEHGIYPAVVVDGVLYTDAPVSDISAVAQDPKPSWDTLLDAYRALPHVRRRLEGQTLLLEQDGSQEIAEQVIERSRRLYAIQVEDMPAKPVNVQPEPAPELHRQAALSPEDLLIP